MKYYFLISLTGLLLIGCNRKPQIIEATTTDSDMQIGMEQATDELHQVVVDEILHTSKYTYLQVSENDQQFWIAIPYKEVEKGATYYYRGGLKKNNFKSTEHDREFESVYLVSNISRDPSMTGTGGHSPHTHLQGSNTPTQSIEPPPGGISIATLFENRDKYSGQTVKVRGRVIKLNNMIMNRNWIHLQDASVEKDDLDLTVTTTDNIMLGAIVAFEGRISLNKDFGAGYKYEIIMEEARLLQ